MIQGAGVQPHPARPESPGVAHRARQEMFPEATAEFGRDDAEVRDLYRSILGHAPQLVPARQRAVRPPRCDEQLNGRIGEMPSDLVIGPVPAVEPMKRFAYGTIAGTVQ